MKKLEINIKREQQKSETRIFTRKTPQLGEKPRAKKKKSTVKKSYKIIFSLSNPNYKNTPSKSLVKSF